MLLVPMYNIYLDKREFKPMVVTFQATQASQPGSAQLLIAFQTFLQIADSMFLVAQTKTSTTRQVSVTIIVVMVRICHTT